VRDEHGRILCVEEVQDRKVEQVIAFLEKLKRWGFAFQSFYIVSYRCGPSSRSGA
jgi:hypothetical protein